MRGTTQDTSTRRPGAAAATTAVGGLLLLALPLVLLPLPRAGPAPAPLLRGTPRVGREQGVEGVAASSGEGLGWARGYEGDDIAGAASARGLAAEAEAWRVVGHSDSVDGLYVLSGVSPAAVNGGKPIYFRDAEPPMLLFYWEASTYWMVGENHNEDAGWLIGEGADLDNTTVWQSNYNGNEWQVDHNVTVVRAEAPLPARAIVSFSMELTVSRVAAFVADPLAKQGVSAGIAAIAQVSASWVDVELSEVDSTNGTNGTNDTNDTSENETRRLATEGGVRVDSTVSVPFDYDGDVTGADITALLSSATAEALQSAISQEVNQLVNASGGQAYDVVVEAVFEPDLVTMTTTGAPTSSLTTTTTTTAPAGEEHMTIGVAVAILFIAFILIAACSLGCGEYAETLAEKLAQEKLRKEEEGRNMPEETETEQPLPERKEVMDPSVCPFCLNVLEKTTLSERQCDECGQEVAAGKSLWSCRHNFDKVPCDYDRCVQCHLRLQEKHTASKEAKSPAAPVEDISPALVHAATYSTPPRGTPAVIVEPIVDQQVMQQQCVPHEASSGWGGEMDADGEDVSPPADFIPGTIAESFGTRSTEEDVDDVVTPREHRDAGPSKHSTNVTLGAQPYYGQAHFTQDADLNRGNDQNVPEFGDMPDSPMDEELDEQWC